MKSSFSFTVDKKTLSVYSPWTAARGMNDHLAANDCGMASMMIIVEMVNILVKRPIECLKCSKMPKLPKVLEIEFIAFSQLMCKSQEVRCIRRIPSLIDSTSLSTN
jgi:hypothetical protein